MTVINFADEAHERGFYVDPMDPDETPLAGITTVIHRAIGAPFLEAWKLGLAGEAAADHYDDFELMDRDEIIAFVRGAADRVRDAAGSRGTIVHRALELHAAGQEPDEMLDMEALPYIEAGLQWFKDFQVEVIWTEASVFSPTYGYAGTTDLICRIGGKVYVADWKTGKSIHSEVGMQLAAARYAEYAYAEGEPVGNLKRPTFEPVEIPEIDGGLVLHLKPNGRYSCRPVKCGPDEFAAFLGALAVHRFRDDKDVLSRGVKPAALLAIEAEVVEEASAESLKDEMPHEDAEHRHQVAVMRNLEASGADLAAMQERAEADLSEHFVDPAQALDAISFAFPGAVMLTVDTLKARATALIDHDAEARPWLAANWPPGAPTFKTLDAGDGGLHFEEIDALIQRGESHFAMPWPDEPMPERQPAPDMAVELQRTVPADAPVIAKIQSMLSYLPADLAHEVSLGYAKLRAPKLGTGEATRTQVAAAALLVRKAKAKARRRQEAWPNSAVALVELLDIGKRPAVKAGKDLGLEVSKWDDVMGLDHAELCRILEAL